MVHIGQLQWKGNANQTQSVTLGKGLTGQDNHLWLLLGMQGPSYEQYKIGLAAFTTPGSHTVKILHPHHRVSLKLHYQISMEAYKTRMKGFSATKRTSLTTKHR